VLSQPIEDHSVLTRLVESFFYVCKIGRIDGFHSDEDPLTACGLDQLNELFVTEKIRADLRDPIDLRIRSDDVSQQGLCTLNVDGKIVIDKENGDLATLLPRAGFQHQ
jgi:hypothetical protein